ncbi:CD1107 family mobile element protein [Adlercreutzia sp. ZJ473]|uniref:CD1107 family mobile element protein n=1 Tax=Adlercreutzia sp. ZJ473 TaxID=2722822 RepID=UPI001551DC6C|nr:DUF4366 domain-containing protein [Adlercreutzia sp. ZJ473]
MSASIKRASAALACLALAAALAVPALAFANTDPPGEAEPAGAEQVEEAPVAPAPQAEEDKLHEGSLSFAGTGSTVDEVVDGESMKFYTIKSPDNSVFYLVVDEKAANDNVYLLTQVNEDDLAALSKGGTASISDSLSQIQSDSAQQPAEAAETGSEPEEPQPQIPAGAAWAVIVALAAGGAFAYYKIKLEPERNERKVEERRVQEFMSPAASGPGSTIPFDTDDDPLNG